MCYILFYISQSIKKRSFSYCEAPRISPSAPRRISGKSVDLAVYTITYIAIYVYVCI